MATVVFNSGSVAGPAVEEVAGITPQPLGVLVVCEVVPPFVGLRFNNSTAPLSSEISEFVRPWRDSPKLGFRYGELQDAYGPLAELGYGLYSALQFTGQNQVFAPRTDLGPLTLFLEIPTGFTCRVIVATTA